MSEAEKLYEMLKNFQEPKGYYFNKDKEREFLNFLRPSLSTKSATRYYHGGYSLDGFDSRLGQFVGAAFRPRNSTSHGHVCKSKDDYRSGEKGEV